MRASRIRFRSLITGLIFVVVCCGFTPYNNVKLLNSPLAGGPFPLASFGCLLLLLLVNPLIGLIRDRWRYNQHEILLVWCMVTVSSCIAYTGLIRTFVVNITSPGLFAQSMASFRNTVLPLVPGQLFPTDPEFLRSLYSGLEGGLDMSWGQILSAIPWIQWVTPLFWWGLFILLVYMTFMGITGLFSHQWIENEKMNFPLLHVPLLLSGHSEGGTLYRFMSNRYFLIGCAIPFLLHTLNGLHTYFPQVPQIPTLILAQPYIPKAGILSGFYKAKIYLFPAFIGFAFLTSKQVSLSLWVFFILGGLLPGVLQALGWRLPAASLGTTFGPVLSRVEEMQMMGAFAVFFFFIVWLARDHFQTIFKTLFARKNNFEEYQGFLAPNVAFYCFAIGLAGSLAWLWLFGMTFVATLLFLAVCLMLQVVSTRLICQGGLPYFTLTAAPSDGFLAMMDTRLIAPLTLYVALVVQKLTFTDMREGLMPGLMHSSRLSEGASPRGRFFAGVSLAVFVGVVVSFVATLALYYKFGINSLPDEWAIETTRRVHENAVQLLNHPEASKEWSMLFAGVGAAVMLLLVVGYHHFIWWPLHPIGYLTTYSSAMQILWFSFVIGWLANTLVFRYGGASTFKQVRNLFVGLVVGDMVMAVFWLVVGFFTPVSYHVLPL